MKKRKGQKTDVSHLSSAEKTCVIHLLQEQNNLLKEKLDRLSVKVKILEGKLAKNSTNSSKPPSSDANKKKKKRKKTTSSKKTSDKKPGGQAGHKGNTLEQSVNPDEVIRLEVTHCAECGNHLKSAAININKRQVFEIPKPKIWIKEYQSEEKYCKKCNCITVGCFPEHITHKTQYGPRAKGLMVYLTHYQLLPFERTRQFFNTVYAHAVSVGTIANAANALGIRLQTIDNEIKQILSQETLVHCDETSMSIYGNKHWLHTVGNERLTHFAIHEKRGKQATLDIGILPSFTGTMVHDHWKSYYHYTEPQHALCNAHHIRELRYLNDVQNIKWANKISTLLVSINDEKQALLTKNKWFTQKRQQMLSDQYDDILKSAQREQAKRGTIDSKNLLKRLKKFKDDVLRFIYDPDVPFTNNLSERDIRMNKVKQKISGCFRNKKFAEHYCKIRSVISTALKNNKSIFEILNLAFHKIISTEDLLVSDS